MTDITKRVGTVIFVLLFTVCAYASGDKEALLRSAIEQKDATEVTRLLEDGVDPNCWYDDIVQPIHLAAKTNYSELTFILIDAGADVNSKNKINGDTALIIAVKSMEYGQAHALVENGADRAIENDEGLTAYDTAKKKEGLYSSRMFKKIIPPFETFNPTEQMTLALINKNNEQVRIALDSGFDPNANIKLKVDFNYGNFAEPETMPLLFAQCKQEKWIS